MYAHLCYGGVCGANADVCPQYLEDIQVYDFVLPLFNVSGKKLFEAYG